MKKLCLLLLCASTVACQSSNSRQAETFVSVEATPTKPVTPKPELPERRAAPASNQAAFELAKPWIDDGLQIRDVAKRDAAIAAVRTALQSADPVPAHAGLIALNQLRSATFEKNSFRELVLPHLTAKDGSMQLAAMYALDAVGREPGDLERILSASSDVHAAQRPQWVHVIATFSDGELIGPAGDAVLKLISSDDRRDVRQSFSGLWGTHVSPAIEKRLLDMSNGADLGNAHDAIYFGLSTLRDKSEAVIDRLIAALSDGDVNNSGRALWGLAQGVPTVLQPRVADTLLQLFEARSDSHTRESSLRSVREYGVERHALALESLAAGAAVDAGMRKSLLETAVAIRRRANASPK